MCIPVCLVGPFLLVSGTSFTAEGSGVSEDNFDPSAEVEASVAFSVPGIHCCSSIIWRHFPCSSILSCKLLWICSPGKHEDEIQQDSMSCTWLPVIFQEHKSNKPAQGCCTYLLYVVQVHQNYSHWNRWLLASSNLKPKWLVVIIRDAQAALLNLAYFWQCKIVKLIFI